MYSNFYQKKLRRFAQELRWNPTKTEQLLWRHLSKAQILNVTFYRQMVVSNYIVDFCAPKINLIIELDGAHHFEYANQYQDHLRSESLRSFGYEMLRFNNRQVMFELSNVLEVIYGTIEKRLKAY